MHRPGGELATFRSRVRRPNHYTAEAEKGRSMEGGEGREGRKGQIGGKGQGRREVVRKNVMGEEVKDREGVGKEERGKDEEERREGREGGGGGTG